MASIFDVLLDDSETLADPMKRQATAAALRKQFNYGTLGQLMGTQPTQQAGAAMQDQSQGSLKLAIQKQQADKEAATAASRQAVMDQRDARNYDQRERGIEATRVNQAATRAGAGPIIDTPGGKVRVGPDNTTTPIMDPTGAQVQGLPKPATESQSTNAVYAARVEQNLPVLTSMIDNGYTPSVKDYTLIATGAPPILSAAGMSKEGKTFYGTASQIVNAIMRKESGAAISASEWANAFARWLPAPGDPPELLAQKRANLNQEMEQLKMQAGPAYKGLGKPEEGQGSSPAATPKPAGGTVTAPRTKTVNGKRFVEVNGEWFAE